MVSKWWHNFHWVNYPINILPWYFVSSLVYCTTAMLSVNFISLCTFGVFSVDACMWDISIFLILPFSPEGFTPLLYEMKLKMTKKTSSKLSRKLSSLTPHTDFWVKLHLTLLFPAATSTWGGSVQITHEPKATNHPDCHTLLLRHKTRKDTTAKNCPILLCVLLQHALPRILPQEITVPSGSHKGL